ncbi:hypothetical protein MOE90_20570 [Bacillus spizizenii]|uniref:hypothetical protein n=1 Tax=Bacillus subtilis TaxID=1423 RepID=UPI00228194B9|nr:hypothetical protein [Bacillus subtilis]MCY9056042.1 hypothetical protein [Bacillus spizizenii]MCY9124909.1 hypothetical protein [Bacillus spizizenii]MEC2335129.1 hypothetical protein [Bacillus subtilis]
MKELALSAMQKVLNNELITQDELDSLRMYLIVLFGNSSARYVINNSTIETINEDFRNSIETDLNTVFSMRYGQ